MKVIQLSTLAQLKLQVANRISNPDEKAAVLEVLDDFKQPVKTYYTNENNDLLAPVEEARKVIADCRSKGRLDENSIQRALTELILERNRLAFRRLQFVDVRTGEVS